MWLSVSGLENWHRSEVTYSNRIVTSSILAPSVLLQVGAFDLVAVLDCDKIVLLLCRVTRCQSLSTLHAKRK